MEMVCGCEIYIDAKQASESEQVCNAMQMRVYFRVANIDPSEETKLLISVAVGRFFLLEFSPDSLLSGREFVALYKAEIQKVQSELLELVSFSMSKDPNYPLVKLMVKNSAPGVQLHVKMSENLAKMLGLSKF